jgi:integrase
LPFSTNFQIESELILKFIENVGIRNKGSAKQYQSRLLSFERFTKEYYNNDNKSNNNNVDQLIQQLQKKELDPYVILNDYCLFIQNNYNISSITFRDKITTVKTFLEFNDIEISPRRFKLKVRYPKTVFKHKEAIDKNDIVRILNGCSEIKLKTYVMLLASTGLRAVEALSIRVKDLDLESNSAKLRIRGEFTKTKVNRYIFITNELKEQIQKWLDFKYRKRRICYIDSKGKTITKYRTPEKNPNEQIFSIYQVNNPNPEPLYNNLSANFAKTLDRIGLGDREDGNETRREITLHSFRRFVKSTISDLGYQDYSEWFIGHAGSTYWRKKDKEKAEIFKKIEPYLTFLDIQQMERKGADMETQITELREINQVLRDRERDRDERDRKSNERLSALEARFWELMETKDKQRKLDREVELETDLELKDAKFDKMLSATRETIKKRSELERTVKEQLENK